MSYNGSGAFVINSTGEPAVANTLITAAIHNALTADLATGLSTAICKDGQTTITQNIPFNGKKITGLGAATARTDAASLASMQDNTGLYVTVGGTANAITLTPSPAITAYAVGQRFFFLATATNTSTVTIAISGLSALAVNSLGATALAAGDIISGDLVQVAHDGTRLILEKATRAGFNMVGGINSAKTTVASAPTPDIFATTVGEYVDYTGTVSCTGFVAAPQAGAERELRCAGAAPFVAGANMLIDGYASGETFTATADDRVIVRAETTTQFRLTIRKRNAKSITPSIRSDGTVAGTADAITINFTPDLILADEPVICFVATGANTITNPTLAVDGGTARTWYKKGGTALAVGDIPGNLAVCIAKYNLANTRWELLNPTPSPSAVLQVASTPLTTTFSTTSATYVAVTGLTATVTPSSVANKLLITGFLSLSAYTTDANVSVGIDVNGSIVGSATSVSSRSAAHTGLGYLAADNIYRIHSVPFSFLYSPASVSAQVVTIHVRNTDTSAQAVYVNRSVDDTDAAWVSRQISNLVVMEIAG